MTKEEEAVIEAAADVVRAVFTDRPPVHGSASYMDLVVSTLRLVSAYPTPGAVEAGKKFLTALSDKNKAEGSWPDTGWPHQAITSLR